MNRDIPADASGAYWPGPPAKTESLPGVVPPIFLSEPLVTEGLRKTDRANLQIAFAFYCQVEWDVVIFYPWNT